MQFTVNGTEYTIENLGNGWFWNSGDDESEPYFETACEAQQSAISHEYEKLDTRHDSVYNEATSQFFDRRDYQ